MAVVPGTAIFLVLLAAEEVTIAGSSAVCQTGKFVGKTVTKVADGTANLAIETAKSISKPLYFMAYPFKRLLKNMPIS